MRFHMGVSFRPKQIIKWLIPILAILGLGFLSDVKADEIAVQTGYNVRQLEFCDVPITEYIDYFERIKGENYNFYVSYVGNQVGFTFYPVITEPTDINYYSANKVTGTTYVNWLKLGSTTENYNLKDEYVFTLSLNDSKCENIDLIDSVTANMDLTDWFESYHDFYTNYQTIFSNINVTNFTGYANRSNVTTAYRVYVNNRNNTYNIYSEFDYTTQGQYLIYSSQPVYYDEEPIFRSFTGDVLPLNWNDRTYYTGDQIDFNYNYQPVLEFNDYTSIRDIFVYTTASNFNNVAFTINYQTIADNFNESYIYLDKIYGQKNVGNSTYTFDEISFSNCMYSESITNNAITFTGLSCNVDFTVYNSISLKFAIRTPDFSSYGSSKVLYDLNVINNYSSGSSLFVNEWRNNYTGDFYFPLILSSFDNPTVNSSYNYFISTTNSYNTLFTVRSNNKALYTVPYSLDPFSMLSTSSNEYLGSLEPYDSITNSLNTNRGVLVTPDPDSSIGTYPYQISFILYKGTYVSLNTDKNYCYYFNNSLSCTVVDQEFFDTYTDDYSVDEWFSVVTNFINGISTDMVNFGGIIQQVFNTIPSFLSSVFVVLFILGNAYIVFKLIKR